MTAFADALAWRPTADGRRAGAISSDWMQGRAAFGGLVAAVALEAMRAEVDPERRPRALHAAFAGPVGPGEAHVRVTPLRTGRSMSHLRAEVEQDGSLRAQVTAAFGADRPSGLTVEPAPPPALPAPDTLPALAPVEGITPRFIRHFDLRFARGLPFTGAAEPTIEGWVRLAEPPGPPHATILALLDAWPCPILSLARWPFPASTVTWTTTFAAVPEAVDPTGWWGFRARAEQAAGGHVAMRGELYAPDGRLAAVEEQLVAVFDAR